MCCYVLSGRRLRLQLDNSLEKQTGFARDV